MDRLTAAAAPVATARRKEKVARAVLEARRRRLDEAVGEFIEAGGTLSQVAELLGVSKSAAQRYADRAKTAQKGA